MLRVVLAVVLTSVLAVVLAVVLTVVLAVVLTDVLQVVQLDLDLECHEIDELVEAADIDQDLEVSAQRKGIVLLKGSV